MSNARALHDGHEEVEQRESGIFVRGAAPTASEVLLDARAVVHAGPIAVYVRGGTGRAPTAAADPNPHAETLGFGLGLRMAAWLAPVQKAQILAVPEYMKAWFPMARVVVVPMQTPYWGAGAIVVAANAVTRNVLRELDAIGSDVALQLERQERRNSLAAYRSA